jgi:hypothetical protein
MSVMPQVTTAPLLFIRRLKKYSVDASCHPGGIAFDFHCVRLI